MLKPGMRVIIPFGPRKITGFVIERKAESTIDKLKSIIDVLDMTPVLTPELLRLGKWLANQTLSLYITTYQAMLPQVLKAKYSKHIVRGNKEQISPMLERYFANKTSLPFDEVIQLFGYRTLQTYIENGDVSVQYEVTSQATKRYQTMMIPASQSILENALTEIPKQATKQQAIIEFFLEHHSPIEQSTLYRVLS